MKNAAVSKSIFSTNGHAVSNKLIKWVTLASHLLSLLDTACRFVMLLPAE